MTTYFYFATHKASAKTDGQQQRSRRLRGACARSSRIDRPRSRRRRRRRRKKSSPGSTLAHAVLLTATATVAAVATYSRTLTGGMRAPRPTERVQSTAIRRTVLRAIVCCRGCPGIAARRARLNNKKRTRQVHNITYDRTE